MKGLSRPEESVTNSHVKEVAQLVLIAVLTACAPEPCEDLVYGISDETRSPLKAGYSKDGDKCDLQSVKLCTDSNGEHPGLEVTILSDKPIKSPGGTGLTPIQDSEKYGINACIPPGTEMNYSTANASAKEWLACARTSGENVVGGISCTTNVEIKWIERYVAEGIEAAHIEYGGSKGPLQIKCRLVAKYNWE